MLRSLTLAADNPLNHVVDVPLIPNEGAAAPFSTILSMHMVTLAVAGALLIGVMIWATRSIATGTDEKDGANRYVTRGAFAHMIEAMCVYLRDHVVKPQLGKDTDRFIGYLWTLFFFILTCNLLGLVPILDLQHLFGIHTTWIGGTATSNIAITAGLATIAFVVIQINGLRSSGVKGWASHFLGGAPLYLAPIMIPVEALGTIIKPFALAVRLFANMIAGHTLLATLMMFTAMALRGLGVGYGAPVTLISFLAGIPIFFLEIFVAFLQAFIFMFLTTIFIAQLMHHHHDEHDHAHDYEGQPGRPPGPATDAVHDSAAPVSQF